MRIFSESFTIFFAKLADAGGGNRNFRSKITIRFTSPPPQTAPLIFWIIIHMIDNSYPFLKSWPYPYLKRITASGVFREPPLRLYINPYIMQFLYLYIPCGHTSAAVRSFYQLLYVRAPKKKKNHCTNLTLVPTPIKLYSHSGASTGFWLGGGPNLSREA